MKTVTGLLVVALNLVLSQPAAAVVSNVRHVQKGGDEIKLPSPVYFDFQPNAGYGTASGMGLSKNQTLVSGGASMSLGVGETFFVAGMVDYRQYGQHSEINAIDGNFQGNRLFFAPVVGVRGHGFVLKFNYQFGGDYRLAKKTVSDTTLTFGDAKGWGLGILYELGGGVHIGINYETVGFTSKTESTQATNNLGTPLTLSQFGMGLAYVY
jgi:hypothetical protein